MTKSKLWKLLVATLALCLLIGTVVGVTLTASADDASEKVIGFDSSDYSDYVNITVNAAYAEANTYKVVEVNGDTLPPSPAVAVTV